MKIRSYFLLLMGSFLLGSSAVVLAQEGSSSSAQAKAWKHESELGVVVVSGNSDTQTINAKQTTSYQFGKNILTFVSNLQIGSSSAVLNTRNWSIGPRYDRILFDRLDLFVSNIWEGNTFAGILYQSNFDIGAKYYFLKAQKKTDFEFFSEFGYRFRYLNDTNNVDSSTHNLRTYFEVTKGLSETARLKLWLEIVPDLGNLEDLKVRFEPSTKLTISSLFSMKVAYLFEFENILYGTATKRIDTTFTTSLVAEY